MIEDIHTQVLVLGSGPAGYSSAFRSADLGLKTVLMEKYDVLGGVCLNVGCIPSKLLLHIAKVIREVQEISSQGVFFDKPKIDISKIRNHKDKIILNLSSSIKNMAKNRNICSLFGTGSFLNSNTVLMNNKIRINFDNVIIATGSKPIKLSKIPMDNDCVWDSTEALSLKKIPKRLLIIGSGIIGLEMATFYSAIGTKVDIIDRCSRVLPFLDKDIMDIFLDSIKEKFNIFLETEVLNVNFKNQGALVTIKNKSNIEKVFYDAILISIGRTPNINSLNLNNTGIKINKSGFITVDNQLRTNVSNIYAIGDVTGQPMLAHKGIHQGHIVSEIIAGNKHFFDPIAIPSVAYTDPEIAWVGINENEAIKKNINYKVALFPWKALGRAIISNCSNGITKLIINKDNNRIIGGEIVGREAGELLSEVTLAIEMGCDIEDISLTIHSHPTLSESIGLTAQILDGSITDLINLKSIKKKI